MGFHATNFTVSVLLTMAVTVFMIFLRMRKPVENSWVMIYWIGVTMATLARPEDLYDYRIIFIGLAAGLMLRFEFMNRVFTRMTMIVEMAIFAYVIYASWIIITTAS